NFCSKLWGKKHFSITLIKHNVSFILGQCGFPESYPDISLLEKFQTENEFPEGHEVLYQCSPGFQQTNGTANSICKDGKWTAVQVTCERKYKVCC
uniref:Sushi domain-containing protein n=1 Tax=Erpetoichthys calabaricus TaxID=27687 RepID=A0A8C4SVM9_ERPCA